MKRPVYFWPIIACVPVLIGLLLAILLQYTGSSNRILHFETRIDLGTLALACGVFLAILFLIIWTISWMYQRGLTRQKAESAQARRRFLRHLDHELKNPLMALQAEIAYLTTWPESYLTPKTFDDMSLQVERLTLLANDLRKLADLEGRTIVFKPVDVGELLRETVEVIQAHPQYPDRQVKLTLLDSPWRLARVSGDRVLLSLALYNLLDNSLKYTQPGDTVELRAFEVRPWVIVEVADSGLGIAEDDLPHIFEELYRGSNARACPGSGLGLTLVKAIVERHNGSISVQSRVGQGTVFTIRLPLKYKEPE